ncbi:MAG: hypothetical protein AAF502_01930 [Bacteroidota bacterium]
MKYYQPLFLLMLPLFFTCALPKSIELEEASSQVIIDGNDLMLDTYLWRDFMPIAPPNGRNLIGQLLIHREDFSPFKPLFSVTGVYIYDDDEWLWSVKPEEKTYEINGSNQVEVVVRDGPKLDTDLKVDVIVVLEFKGERYLLKADDQTIHRTY